MKNRWPIVSFFVVAAAGVLAAAQGPAAPAHPSLQGEWTYNAGASTKAPDLSQPGPRSGRPQSPNRGGGGGGGPFGGGGNRLGRRGGDQTVSPPQTAGGGTSGAATPRLNEMMRDLETPPTRLTITQTDQLIVITSEDGRTTRLTPNGKKVKDPNADVQRVTTWDGEKLVNQLSGMPAGDVQQVYVPDDQVQHRLHVITTLPNRQDPKNPIVLDRVYDATAP